MHVTIKHKVRTQTAGQVGSRIYGAVAPTAPYIYDDDDDACMLASGSRTPRPCPFSRCSCRPQALRPCMCAFAMEGAPAPRAYAPFAGVPAGQAPCAGAPAVWPSGAPAMRLLEALRGHAPLAGARAICTCMYMWPSYDRVCMHGRIIASAHEPVAT